MTTHTSPPSELEYLEVFDFFNYPRLNAIAGMKAIDPTVVIAPVTPTQGQQGNGQAGTAGGYRATPAFVIPNPESDWLIFKPPYE